MDTKFRVENPPFRSQTFVLKKRSVGLTNSSPASGGPEAGDVRRHRDVPRFNRGRLTSSRGSIL
jgi:hypothetical protein